MCARACAHGLLVPSERAAREYRAQRERKARGKHWAAAMAAVAALPRPATSEWEARPEPDGASKRYAITPEEVAKALNLKDVPLQEHNLDTVAPPARNAGAHVQMMLRKRADDTYQILFNGRESQGTATDHGETEHVLPRILRADQLIREDASGRLVPAPVLVGVIVETGALPPDAVKLQVVQRTIVGGMQVDAGRERVLSEVGVPPARPTDAECTCVAVAYPMTLSAPATIQIYDLSKQKADAEKEKIKNAASLFEGVSSIFSGRIKRGAKQVFKSLSSSKLALIGPILVVLPTILAPTTVAGSRLISGIASGIRFFLRYGITTLVTSFALKRTEEERDLDTEKRVDISVFDLPSMIKRIGGYREGGIQSKLGRALTTMEMRKQGRPEDALLLETLTALNVDALDDEEAKEFKAALRTAIAAGPIEDEDEGEGEGEGEGEDEDEDEDEGAIDAKVEAVFQATLRGIEDAKLYNRINLSTITKTALEMRPQFETVLRIHVVDGHLDNGKGHQTFLIRSDRSFEAGLIASGYSELRNELAKAVSLVENDLLEAGWRDESVPILARAKEQTKLSTYLAAETLGLGQPKLWPTADEMLRGLRTIANWVDAKLEALLPDVVLPPTVQSGYVSAEATRYLPHVVRLRNEVSSTLVVQDSEGVAVSTIAASIIQPGGFGGGLGEAVASATATLRLMRQAVGHYIESEGTARGRARLCMHAKRFAIASDLEDGCKIESREMPLGGNNVLQTSLVYSPRMPLGVVDALAEHDAHPRLEEAMRVQWLSRPYASDGTRKDAPWKRTSSGVGIARALGLPTSHEGELVAGVIAEMAMRDAMMRTSAALLTAPARAQLMETSVQRAVRELRLAADLGKRLFRRPEEYQGWLDQSDAAFDCFPGGAALRMVLQECAAWRDWGPPWTWEAARTQPLGRFTLLEAAAQSKPVGADSLRRLLLALSSLRPDTDVPLQAFPFLGVQTVRWHTVDTLPPLWLHATSAEHGLVHRHARNALQIQVVAAYESACRVSVMATAMAISGESHLASATLRECVSARPVVGMAIEVANATTEALALLDAALATTNDAEDEPMLQPTMPTVPPASTLFDNASVDAHGTWWMGVRMAALRFDVQALAEASAVAQRKEDMVDALVNEFRGVRVDTEPSWATYLCAFAGGFVAELSPTMGRSFEDFPVYLALLPLDDPFVLDDPVRSAEIRVRTRSGGGERDSSLHPLVLASETGGDVTFQAAYVTPVSPVAIDEAGEGLHTLRTEWERGKVAMSRAPLAHGAGVDAASALLWNVERLLQALLVLVGHGHTEATIAHFVPPPPPNVPLATVAPKPTESPTLIDATRKANLLALSLQAETSDALLALKTSDNASTLKDKIGTIKERLDTLKRAKPDAEETIDMVRKAEEQCLSAFFGFFSDGWKGEDVETLLQTARNADGEFVKTNATTTSANGPKEVVLRRRALRQMHLAIVNMRRDLEESVALWTERSAAIDAENERRLGIAKQAFEHDAGLWPMSIVIARALCANIVVSVPRLHIVDTNAQPVPRAAHERFVGGVRACQKRGIRAVPIAELVAVVARF